MKIVELTLIHAMERHIGGRGRIVRITQYMDRKIAPLDPFPDHVYSEWTGSDRRSKIGRYDDWCRQWHNGTIHVGK